MKNFKHILLLTVVCLLITGCTKEQKEKRIITKNAINYFTEKYNLNKKDIEIKTNRLFGENNLCFDSCGENQMIIIYNEK